MLDPQSSCFLYSNHQTFSLSFKFQIYNHPHSYRHLISLILTHTGSSCKSKRTLPPFRINDKFAITLEDMQEDLQNMEK